MFIALNNLIYAARYRCGLASTAITVEVVFVTQMPGSTDAQWQVLLSAVSPATTGDILDGSVAGVFGG